MYTISRQRSGRLAVDQHISGGGTRLRPWPLARHTDDLLILAELILAELSNPRARAIMRCMAQEPPPPSLKVVALLLLGGAGLGFVAVGVTTAWGWTFLAPGFIALLVSLLGVWTALKPSDKTRR
jgi:hypothetical protein